MFSGSATLCELVSLELPVAEAMFYFINCFCYDCGRKFKKCKEMTVVIDESREQFINQI